MDNDLKKAIYCGVIAFVFYNLAIILELRQIIEALHK